MSFENLLLDRDGAVAILTINRPSVRNALNSQTMDELRRALLDLRRDDSVRCVIITGAGDKAFVAGADINELAVQRADPGANLDDRRLSQGLVQGKARGKRRPDASVQGAIVDGLLARQVALEVVAARHSGGLA